MHERRADQRQIRLTFQRSRLLRVSAELDEVRRNLQAAPLRTPPFGGWSRYLRDALNMNGAQLGRRVNVRQPTIARFEQNEREDSITLATLRRLADALGCDLVYAFVPRVPLTDMVERQIRRAAEVAARRPTNTLPVDELERYLQLRMPRWIWGSWDHPELWTNDPAR